VENREAGIFSQTKRDKGGGGPGRFTRAKEELKTIREREQKREKGDENNLPYSERKEGLKSIKNLRKTN